jgi:methyl-accepting chemotaxis protein
MKTLRSKLMLPIMLSLVVGVGLTVVAAMSIATKTLTSAVYENLTNLVKATAFNIQDINNQEYKLLETFSLYPEIRDENVELKEKWQKLNLMKNGNQNYIGMAFYDKNGIGWTTTGKYQDLHDRPYLAKAMQGVNSMLDPAWSPVNGQISTFYAVPVFSTDGNQIGEAVSVVDSMILCETLKEMKIGDTYPFVISMNTGNYVASVDTSLLKASKNISSVENPEFQAIIKKAMNGETGINSYTDSVTGKKKLVAYSPVGGDCDWTAIIDVPYANYFKGLDSMIKVALFCLLISIALCFGFLITIISKFLKPLNNFNKIMITNSENEDYLDLTNTVSADGDDELSSVIKNYNKFNGKLKNVILDITESKNQLALMGESLDKSVKETSSSIQGILSNINEVASQINIQADSVSDTSNAVNTIAENISSLGKLIENQSEGFAQVSSATEEMIANINTVEQSVEKMAEEFETVLIQIKDSSKKQDEVNSLIEQVSEQSQMLNEANTVIASIAEQTNLLAMNAAIEAAHAGDAGKGFSVVADEIRKLSETSSEQSGEISEQLYKITSSIEEVVEGSGETKTALNSVSDLILQTNQIVVQIKDAMSEQSKGSKQIIDVLTTMNENTAQVKNASEKMEEGNSQILSQVENLENATKGIRESVEIMNTSARQIEENGKILDTTYAQVHKTIDTIGSHVEKIHV